MGAKRTGLGQTPAFGHDLTGKYGNASAGMSFFSELKQRNVFRVALLYMVAAWLILQVGDVLLPNLGAPEWAFKLVLGLLVLFFVPALVFAWVYEITPEGVQREQAGEPATRYSRRRIDSLIIILLVLAIGGLIADRLVPEQAGTPVVATGTAVAPEPADSQPVPTAADERSIAVLPFDTRSADPADAYFSAGIHDDLLTQLAKIDGLKVISRTSVMQYAGTSQTMREIAEELDVATVLEGGVQRAGDRIRVNAQLIDARTDQHLWAETYDEALSAANIFAIQSRLATAIAGALETRLSPGTKARIAARPTESLTAWDLELRGRYLMDRERSKPNYERAVALFRQAIDEDPEYALPWAGVAQGIIELVGWSYWPDESLDEARAAADRAIELDPNLAQGYFARGDLLRFARRFEEGEAAFQRGLGLSPGSADGHSRYGDLLRDAGRPEESVRQSLRAVELDPHMLRIRESLLQNLYFGRDWDGVLREAAQVLEMEPDSAETWYWIAFANNWLKNYDAAIGAARKAVELDDSDPYLRSGLAYHYALAGRADEAREMLASPDVETWPLPETGLIYAALGELDRAFEYMNRSLDEQPYRLYYLEADPAADPMRADPRWPALMARLRAER
jgi:TolB-like protein/Tfp pilus assembly protein PilF